MHLIKKKMLSLHIISFLVEIYVMSINSNEILSLINLDFAETECDFCKTGDTVALIFVKQNGEFRQKHEK